MFCPENYKESFFFDLFLQFVLVNDFLEVSESFGCVLEDLMFFDVFTDNFIQDYLEPHRDATTFQVVIVLFLYLFDLRVFFMLLLLNV